MTKAQEDTVLLNKRSYWLGVLTIVITVILGLLSGAVIVGQEMQIVEELGVKAKRNEMRIDKHEQRITTVEQTAIETMHEVKINLKFFMEKSGVKYQEAK
jgi:hypothetical protein